MGGSAGTRPPCYGVRRDNFLPVDKEDNLDNPTEDGSHEETASSLDVPDETEPGSHKNNESGPVTNTK